MLTTLFITIVLCVFIALVQMVRGGAARSPVASGRRPGARAAALLILWLGFTAGLALSGLTDDFNAVPPRLPLLALSAAAFVVLGLTGPVARPDLQSVVASMPLAWPVALQTFRLPLELFLFAQHRAGQIPVQMTFDGRNFDILVGLTAPLLAFAIATGRAPRWLVAAWNVLGLCLLFTVVGLAISSAPGPLRLDWPSAPLTLPARFPYVWLPAFLVPVAFAGHFVALWKLARGRVAGGAPERAAREPRLGAGHPSSR